MLVKSIEQRRNKKVANKNLIIRIGVKGARKTRKALNGVGNSLKGISKVASIAGLGIAGLSVKLAEDFSKSLREISTLMSNVTEKDIKKMSKELRVLSGDSGLALDSLSKAKYDIVSAGFANAADSAEVLAVSAKLAVGGVTTAASAADILTTALNAYGKSAKESEKVADILFTTVKFGKTTMDELSASLGRVLPLARASKASLETVGAAMATLTSSGIKTAEATTFLRGALQALDAPTKAAAKEMFDAGISAKHFDDGSLDLLSTIKQFEGMDTKTLTKFIPSQEAITAILTMSNNIDVLADNLAGFEDTAGAAETAFGKMAKEFNIKMSRLKNNISSALIEFGSLIIEKITPIVDSFNKVLGKLGEIGWDVIAKDLTDNWRDVLGVMGQLVGIMLKPIPATIGAIFRLAGKAAVEAFKKGAELFASINWGEVIFGSPAKRTMLGIAKRFGVDTANHFIEHGYIGRLDALKGGWGTGGALSHFLYDEYKAAIKKGITPSTKYLTQKLIETIEISTGNIITDTKAKSYLRGMVENFMSDSMKGVRLDTEAVFGDWRVPEGMKMSWRH